jgi:hypothetical protein
VKRSGVEPSPAPRPPENRGTRWKRTLLLVPLLVGLFFVAVTERGHPANGKAGARGTLMAALTDPLSLFADRSPGGRGAGALLSTKPMKTAMADPGPEERVLAGVRDRDPPADGLPELPGLNDPAFAAGPGVPPAGGGAPGDPGGGSPSFAPFSSLPGLGGPGFISGGGGPPGSGPPGSGPPGSDPPGGVGGGPPGLPPVLSAVPEPGTWAMLIFGFFAVGAAMRRRVRIQAGSARVQ